jgi:hypothetical protein
VCFTFASQAEQKQIDNAQWWKPSKELKINALLDQYLDN